MSSTGRRRTGRGTEVSHVLSYPRPWHGIGHAYVYVDVDVVQVKSHTKYDRPSDSFVVFSLHVEFGPFASVYPGASYVEIDPISGPCTMAFAPQLDHDRSIQISRTISMQASRTTGGCFLSVFHQKLITPHATEDVHITLYHSCMKRMEWKRWVRWFLFFLLSMVQRFVLTHPHLLLPTPNPQINRCARPQCGVLLAVAPHPCLT